MDIFYWIKEYILVFLAYGILTFVWPEIVFRKWLRGRSLTEHLCFDSMFMLFAVNMYVLLLGLCHILNPWVVRVGFWGGLLASIAIPFFIKKGDHTLERFKALLIGAYGIKSFGRNVAFHTRNIFKKSRKKVNIKITNHILIYALLALAVIYGMIYYSMGVFESPTFGFTDLYVHEKWAYELTKGHIFSGGIYPEGMHTYAYMINACFGVSLYSVMLFLQPVHIALLLLVIFLLAKEIYNWRYTAVTALILFLTVGYSYHQTVFMFSRLQCTLPMEFGASATLICPLFLLRYLKDVRKNGKTFQYPALYKDANLIIFGLALFNTISIHFYCTIIAFFLCLAIVPVYFKETFSGKHFLRLLLTVLTSVFIAVLPMLLALAEGMQFQGSIGWAIDVMQGKKGNTEEVIIQPGVIPTPGTSDTDRPGTDIIIDDYINKNTAPGLSEILDRTYGVVFGNRAALIYKISALVALAAIIGVGLAIVIINLRRKKKGLAKKEGLCLAPLGALMLMLINIMIMGNPKLFGLPRLIDMYRLNYYATLLNLMVFLIPVDLCFGYIKLFLKGNRDGIIAVAVVISSLIVVVNTGIFHGALYFELTGYSSVASITQRIIRENEKESFTIVSTGTETWQIAGSGYHEELINFVNGTIAKSYKLPTDKVYIYVEKHPIQYIQQHFPEIPFWLADGEQSQNLLQFTRLVSTGSSNVIGYELDAEKGKTERVRFTAKLAKSLSALYRDKNTRILIESRAMNWIEEFEDLYPRTLKVYYEDEDFVCYYFEQNPNATFELAIQEMNIEKDPISAPTVEPPVSGRPEEENQGDYIVEYIFNPETGEITTRVINSATGDIVVEVTE